METHNIYNVVVESRALANDITNWNECLSVDVYVSWDKRETTSAVISRVERAAVATAQAKRPYVQDDENEGRYHADEFRVKRISKRASSDVSA